MHIAGRDTFLPLMQKLFLFFKKTISHKLVKSTQTPVLIYSLIGHIQLDHVPGSTAQGNHKVLAFLLHGYLVIDRLSLGNGVVGISIIKE